MSYPRTPENHTTPARRRGPRRRGDDIPPVSAYSHWNEEAEAVWFLENRYDMEHADEIIEDDGDWIEDDGE